MKSPSRFPAEDVFDLYIYFPATWSFSVSLSSPSSPQPFYFGNPFLSLSLVIFHDFCPFLSSLTPSFTGLSDCPHHPLFGFSFSSRLASPNADPQDSSPGKASRVLRSCTKGLLHPRQPHLHKELNLKREFPPATV